MAFSLSERFPPQRKTYHLLDPGAYQNTGPLLLRLNKVPFLSKAARGSSIGGKIWTHALHNADKPLKSSNCTSLRSKVPRFPYEALTNTDIETILCQCGIENPCECSIEEDKEEIICQAKVHRKLFKGLTPKLTLGEGLSVPSKKDNGFKVSRNGTKIRIFKNVTEESAPFYDTRVVKSTTYYQGCKWSKWTSKRDQQPKEDRPGPASYTIKNQLTFEAFCAEKVRASRRKTSKQYRFIEIVQRRNVLEGTPGPADYTPNFSKGNKLKLLGSKAERFATGKYDVIPGPAEYSIKRDFDGAEPPQIFSNAKIAAPAFFGIKAERFKPRHEDGPSPASYDPSYRPKQSKYCIKTPFGSTSKRFKEVIIENGVTDSDLISGEGTLKDSSDKSITMELPTWGFRSKTIRLKPLLKKFDEPSPADLAQSNIEIMRSHQLQCNCPFFSSDGRFQPWFNWIPIHGKNKTPGPACYCLNKPKCRPAVNCGPMYRSPRFTVRAFQTPAPNAYRVDGGIENILATHNNKLKNNIENKHEFHWSPPLEPSTLSVDAQEAMLLKKSIALLEVHDIFEYKESAITKSAPPSTTSNETKLLRCFLKSQQIAEL